MDRYRVIAPYVLAKTVTQDGVQIKGLNEGALVPDSVDAEWVERHLRKRMIEPIGGDAPPPQRLEDVPPTRGHRLPGVDVDPDPDVPASSSRPEQTPQPPPPTGPGSGKQAWVDYAAARGMDRDEANGMGRDDLIAALREG